MAKLLKREKYQIQIVLLYSGGIEKKNIHGEGVTTLWRVALHTTHSHVTYLRYFEFKYFSIFDFFIFFYPNNKYFENS